jgi:CheY-like chemotaxis protein
MTSHSPFGRDEEVPSPDGAAVAGPDTTAAGAVIPFERAFGIAHVMTNLLAVVAGHLEEIQDQRHDPAGAREAAAAGLLAAERAARLMRGMMASLNGHVFRPGRCDSTVLLRAIHASRSGPGMAMVALAPGEPLPLLVDPVALSDLLANTLDAVQPAADIGVIRLGCRPLAAFAGLAPGRYGAIEISGGHWQAPMWQQRALGGDWRETLMDFCRAAGGTAEIRQDLSGGLSITLMLPLIDERPAQHRPAPEPVQKGHVLVVEDDELVRLQAERVIASLGYGVVSAPSGEEALAILETAGPVDVLFTDVVMPGGMSGGELAERFGRLRPGIPIVFTSGHNADPTVAAILRREGAAILPKPYRRKSLAEILDAAVARAGATTTLPAQPR